MPNKDKKKAKDVYMRSVADSSIKDITTKTGEQMKKVSFVMDGKWYDINVRPGAVREHREIVGKDKETGNFNYKVIPGKNDIYLKTEGTHWNVRPHEKGPNGENLPDVSMTAIEIADKYHQSAKEFKAEKDAERAEKANKLPRRDKAAERETAAYVADDTQLGGVAREDETQAEA